MDEDMKTRIVEGLQSCPKYLPVWYRYDKEGSAFNDMCLTDNPHYYMCRCEVAAIKSNIKTIVDQMAPPCTLVDMGSGNCEKTKMFIESLIEKQGSVVYVPVDISKDALKEASDSLMNQYGDKIQVRPVAGDYSKGIAQIGKIDNNKIIIWLGGGFQNIPADTQVQYLSSIADCIKDNDRLLVAIDMTQNAQEIENAYFDPAGKRLYLNAIWRLNREFGSNIDVSKFDLMFRFIHNMSHCSSSFTQIRLRSKQQQIFPIPGLGISLSFDNDEYMNLFEGEGVSRKYTEGQVKHLVTRGNCQITNLWKDDTKHIGLFSLKKL